MARWKLILFVGIVGFQAKAQSDVLTQHYDQARTGWFNNESTLTVNNVRPGLFGELFKRPVDDQLYAQPLLMQVNLPGIGQRNLVILATVNNSVYAFDADSASVTDPYWQVNLTPSGSRPPKNTDMTGACGGGYRDFSGNMGIVGTPVIDPATETLYVVARSVTASNDYAQYLHALDLTTGAERPNSPVLITATITAGGDGSVGGQLSFDPQKQNQRPGLLLLNNNVYIAWASHCDWSPYHGWIIGYDATTLAQTRVYNATPEGYNGGIWMCGGGLTADDTGDIYFGVGNGSAGKNGDLSNTTNRSESAVRIRPNGTGFTVEGFFTPKNYETLEAGDLDFGTTQVLLLPGTSQAVASCKDGTLYLLDRDNMGGYNATSNNVLQSIDLGNSAYLHSSLAYYKGAENEWLYTWSENSLLKAFPYVRASGLFDLGGTVSSPVQGPVGYSGAFLSVSSNGSVDSTAILWASYAANGDANQSVRPGILRAFDANDVTHELWNSSIYPNDNPGNYAKFNCPVIANGKVYLATFSNQLVVYGLLPGGSTSLCDSSNVGLNGAAEASSGVAQNAFDDDPSSEWSTGTTDDQWISVDLSQRYDLCGVRIHWGERIGINYDLQVSDDNQNWANVISIKGNSSAVSQHPVAGTGRYIRLLCSTGQNGYDVSELELLGSLSTQQCPSPYLLPVTNVYGNTATINWSSGADHFMVGYKTVSAANWNELPADTTSLTLNALACATDFLYRVQAICGIDTTDYVSGSFSTIACDANCAPLPTRWSTLDVGDVHAAGSACFEDGVFSVSGSGRDIWDTEDAFRFVYKTFVGDGEMEARVVSMDNTNDWNKVGIMFRESLAAGSRHVFIALTSANGVALQDRTQTDGFSDNANTGPGITAPYWLKLEKQGIVYVASYSTDGKDWTRLSNPINGGFGDGTPVYAGFAVTSHNDGVLCHAVFDNMFITGAFEYELLDFEAELNLDETVNLTWTTDLEGSIQRFVTQRATTGDYADLDTLSAVNHGRFTQNYTAIDGNPPTGLVYYRLKMVSLDGIIRYSAPAAVWIGDTAAPVIIPNPAPAPGSTTVTIAQGDPSDAIRFVNVYDLSGHVVMQLQNNSTSGITAVPVTGFANGIYIFEIITSRSRYKTRVMIRN